MTRHAPRNDGKALCNRRIEAAPLGAEVPTCRSCLRILAKQQAVQGFVRRWTKVIRELKFAAALALVLTAVGCAGMPAAEPTGAAAEIGRPAASFRYCGDDRYVAVEQADNVSTCVAAYVAGPDAAEFNCYCPGAPDQFACDLAYNRLSTLAQQCMAGTP